MSTLAVYSEHYRAAVQRLVPDELVLSVGIFTAAHRITHDGTREPWLARDVALGAGTTNLHAVRFVSIGMEIDAREVIGSWARARTAVTLLEAAVLRLLVVRDTVDALRDVVELTSPRQLGSFDHVNDSLYRELGVERFPVSTPPGS